MLSEPCRSARYIRAADVPFIVYMGAGYRAWPPRPDTYGFLFGPVPGEVTLCLESGSTQVRDLSMFGHYFWLAACCVEEWALGCIFCARAAREGVVSETKWSRFEVSTSIQFQNIRQRVQGASNYPVRTPAAVLTHCCFHACACAGQQHQRASAAYMLPDAEQELAAPCSSDPAISAAGGVYMEDRVFSDARDEACGQASPKAGAPQRGLQGVSAAPRCAAVPARTSPAMVWPKALPKSLWLKVFQVTKAASSGQGAMDVAGLSPHKLFQMVWCLAEAKREQIEDGWPEVVANWMSG